MYSLKGKCAIVTGSTAGQGARVAEALAEQGCDLILNGLGDSTNIESQRSEMERKYGVKVSFHAADLQRPEDVAALVRHGEDLHGAIDILVNNAVVRHSSPIEDYPLDQWSKELAVNLTAPMLAIKAALPGMRRKGWGRIINMSSTQGIAASANRVGYVTTKTALLGLTRAVATETRGTNITCNALCPAAMIGMNSEAKIRQIMADDDLTFEAAADRFLVSRNAERFVETLPAIVVFLCSEAGRDISGISMPVDLGSTAAR